MIPPAGVDLPVVRRTRAVHEEVTVFCSRCGRPMAPGANFCSICGNASPGETAAAFAPPSATLMNRPAVITLLAVLDLVFGAIWALVAIVTAISIASGKFDGADVALFLVFGALGALAIVAGIGLLRMKEFGRIVQLGLSCIGLLGVPVGTIISALVLYYLTRPGVKVLFSGKRAEQLSPAETNAVLQLQSSGGVGVVIAVVVGLLAIIAFTGIIAAIAVPNLLTAMQRAKQKRTMADMRSVATAWEAYATDTNTYSPTTSFDPVRGEEIMNTNSVTLRPSARLDADELARALTPTYMRTFFRTDGWEQEMEFYIGSGGQEYAIRSLGKDGVPEGNEHEIGTTSRFQCDIVYATGSFVSYPEGAQSSVSAAR